MATKKQKFILIFFVILSVSLAGGFFLYRLTVPKAQGGSGFWMKVLKVTPNNPKALTNLAESLRKEEGFDQALQDYNKVVELQKEGLEANLSASVLENVDRVKAVIEHYKKAIENQNDYWPAYLGLAEVYEQTGQLTDAFNVYIQLVKLNPKLKEPHIRLGYLYGVVGDVKSAIVALKHVLFNFPKEEDSYLNVITVYNALLAKNEENLDLKAGRIDAMNAYADFVNKSEPKASNFFNLGVIYHQKGDFERALSAYQSALDLNPRHSRACYNIGNIYRDQGRFNEALLMYKKAVNFDPKFADGYLNAGGIFAKRGEWDEAKDYYEKAIHADPKSAKSHFSLGLVLERAGQLIEAARAYEKATALEGKNPEFYYYLGHAYANLKNSKGAEKAYLKAVTISPNHAKAWINLSKLAYEAKDYQKALQYIEEARLSGFDVPQAYVDELKALTKN